ncbi:ABC transporter permease [Nocardia cyriacigeorgica]|uniref:ABC transporter permease n=1 Tax=Nocardia cyriacigeorgica TaxID=135487 RepID=UPI001895D15A|nr:ABC transporter permease [Nocardia cyriacigeorgica]MBF6452760.1 ABC transporter permease [Nocardia cyriacigeorgica]MBF6479844.1 ABC transporter permease [Nocardia cyriacigeorgica]MBF6549929.1 ABC transporter permease [Nocardia cyriacigeorgica]
MSTATATSSLSAALFDSSVMLRRNFTHITRSPVTVFNAALMPVVMMLIFVYVFGDAFDVGGDYIDYAVPGMLMLAISYGLSGTAVAVSSDMTKGVINRFKVMDVSRGAVLTGHVAASMVTNIVAIAAVLGVGFALGFRSPADAVHWLGALGVLLATAFAAAWLTVALGMSAKTPEAAGMSVVPLIMLPFLSSAIVPADKMGPGVRQFAEYQPFTPIIESVRGFLAGTPSTADTLTALAWCAGFAIIGYVWSRATFSKRA